MTKLIILKLKYTRSYQLQPVPMAARSKAWICGLSLARWDCGFESRRGHGCLSFMSRGPFRGALSSVGVPHERDRETP